MQPNPVYVEAYTLDGIFSAPPQPSTSSSSDEYLVNLLTRLQPVNEAGAREFLTSARWPVGLQDTFVRNLANVPIRFFICDDSGSMCSSDGHMLLGNDPRSTKMVTCSRWAELAASLTFHSNLAYQANALTEFRLLNSSAPILIGDASDPQNSNRLAIFQSLLKNSPGGGTPLCKHVKEVVNKIKRMESSLRANGQKACVVILTDGESSDGNLSTAMQDLKALPVWTVVRLCTDEEKVVDYWNNIDNELELDMDVLDDLCGEAQEVRASNPWLTYGEPLHRLREFGIPIKELDLLDEAKLSLDQIRNFVSVLFGGKADDYPHPEVNRRAFLQAVEQEARRLPMVWSPISRSPKLWVDARRMVPSGGCVVC
eukprot:gene5675-6258_t